MEIDTKEAKSVIDNLKRDGEKTKYYVYALCEKRDNRLIPFYIGKGQGDRVWQHELGEEKERKRIEEEIAKAKQEGKAYENAIEEQNNSLMNISAKYKRISSIKKNNNYIEKVIVKCGLTSEEAFVAESALINLFRLVGPSLPENERLTNIANGHSTKAERVICAGQNPISAARSVDQFYSDCCREAIDIKQLSNAILISVNKTYQACWEDDDPHKAICDAARGAWWVRKNDPPQYLLAVYQSKIVGAYKILDCVRVIDDLSNYPHLPYAFRDKENAFIDALKKCPKREEYIDLSDEAKNAFLEFIRKSDNRQLNEMELEKEYHKWSCKKYYRCAELKNEDKFRLTGMENVDLVGRLICNGEESAFPPRTEKRYTKQVL